MKVFKFITLGLIASSHFCSAEVASIVVNENGKVGINMEETTEPSTQLEVNGIIKASEGMMLNTVADLPVASPENQGTIVFHDGKLKVSVLNDWLIINTNNESNPVLDPPSSIISGGD